MFIRLTSEHGDAIWVNPKLVAAIKSQVLSNHVGVRKGVGSLLILGANGELTGELSGLTVQQSVEELLKLFSDGEDGQRVGNH